MTQQPSSALPKYKSPWRWLGRFFIFLLLLLLTALGGISYIYHTQLTPESPDEWTYVFKVRNFSFPLSIPKTILWASSPRIAPWLDGIEKKSSHGQYKLHWDEVNQSLVVNCEQCINRVHGLGADDFTFGRIALHIHQDQQKSLSGHLILGSTSPVDLSWSGRFTKNTLIMGIIGKDVPIRSIYQTLTPQLSELQSADITGNLNIALTAALPALEFTLGSVQVDNFTVSGLGTEKLIGATSRCGPPANLPMDNWLVRSVMSAEDQRFETHPGYDLEELMLAFNQNHAQGSIIRGGSTISQQTAKLLFTGSEKSLERKMRELLYAVEMEQTLGKARIMQLYLDNAPWGLDADGKFICGAQTAAQNYFGLDAIDLLPHQAVWMAAMLHSPVSEAKKWRDTGRINLSRATWIARYVRNAPNSGPRARQKVIDTLKRDPSLGFAPATPSP